MDLVHESGPWTRSKVGVHGPLVHVLSSPVFGSHIVFLHSGERDHVAVLLTLRAKWLVTPT